MSCRVRGTSVKLLLQEVRGQRFEMFPREPAEVLMCSLFDLLFEVLGVRASSKMTAKHMPITCVIIPPQNFSQSWCSHCTAGQDAT